MEQPEWFTHQNGSLKIKLEHRILTIQTGSFEMHLSRAPKRGWAVRWRVSFNGISRVKGQAWLDARDLLLMFGLARPNPGEWDKQLLIHFGADVAKYGCYVRRGQYLCLGAPGHGYPGDLAACLFLTAEIQSKAEALLASTS